MITGIYKYVCTRNRTQSGMENTLEFILSYEIFATRTTFSWKSARFEEEIKETETSANYIS